MAEQGREYGHGESKVVDLMAALEQSVKDAREAARAERDARREQYEAELAAKAEAERDRLATIIGHALSCRSDEWDGEWFRAGRVAVEALETDGVVFAYLGSTSA